MHSKIVIFLSKDLIITLVVIILFIRFISSQSLQEGAAKFRAAIRAAPINDMTDGGAELSYSKFIALWVFYLDKDDKDLLAELHGGRLPSCYRGPFRDQLALRDAYSRLREDDVRLFHNFDLYATFGAGLPLIDLLIYHMTVSVGSLKVPTLRYLKDVRQTRGVCMSTLKSGHEVFEVTCGASCSWEVDKAVTFFREHFAQDQKECPTGVISFDVESVHIATSDWKKIPLTYSVLDKPIVCRQAAPGVPATMLPVKLILGGRLWTLCIRLDVLTEREDDGEIVYTIHNSHLQPKLVEFMSSLPVATGFAVRHDLIDWSSYMRRLGYQDFKFKNSFVDCSALAVLAGFHSKRRTMFNTNLQVLGSILPKNNSRADGLWSLRYEELPDEFKVYIIGDTRCAHHVYTVVFTALLHEIFPDAEVVCQLTDKSEFQVASWFAEFVVGMLKGLEVDQAAYAAAATREQLLASLRVREAAMVKSFDHEPGDISSNSSDDDEDTFPAGKLRPFPPERVVSFSKVISPSPTVSFGGARFIVSTRVAVAAQAELLKNLDVAGVTNIFKDVVFTQEIKQWVTYGQTIPAEYPRDPTLSQRFTSDPGCTKPVISIDPNFILNSGLTQMSRCQGRPARLLILEWGRLADPEDLLVLLRRASEEGGDRRESRLWISPLSRYEELRVLYTYLTGSPSPVKCAWAEKRISDYRIKATARAESDLEQLQTHLVAAKRRLSDLQELESAPSKKRVNMETHITPAPIVGKMTTEAQRARRRRNKKRRRDRQRALASTASDEEKEVFLSPADHVVQVIEDEEQEVCSMEAEVQAFRIPSPVGMSEPGSFYSRVAQECEKAGI